jgi:prepilin-type N-terminal cleavage/methylation domain-containing protein
MRAPPRDDGYSLIEVLVAMVISSVVLGLVTASMIGMLRNGASASSRLANLDQIRIGVDALSKNLRTAVRPEQLNPSCVASCSAAFESIDNSKVVFYANVGDKVGTAPAPTRITYAIAADPADTTGTTAAVTETRQKVASTWTTGDYTWAGGTGSAPCPAGGAAVAGCVTRVFSRGITWPLPASNGPLFTYYDGTHAAVATSPTPAASVLARIASIRIALPVGDPTHPSPGVSTSVFLPNSTLGH